MLGNVFRHSYLFSSVFLVVVVIVLALLQLGIQERAHCETWKDLGVFGCG